MENIYCILLISFPPIEMLCLFPCSLSKLSIIRANGLDIINSEILAKKNPQTTMMKISHIMPNTVYLSSNRYEFRGAR